MSEEQQEILTGRAGIEASQGFAPGSMASDVAPEEPISINDALDPVREGVPEEPITEIKYQVDGLEQPENISLTIEQASRGLAEHRNRNADAIEAQLKESIAAEADELRANKPADQMSPEEWAAYHAMQQPVEQQQPEQIPGVDPEVQAALSNPKVLSLLQGYEQQINQQAAEQAAQFNEAKTAFANGLKHNAALAVGAMLSIPELAGHHRP
jgi:hypothetical protein